MENKLQQMLTWLRENPGKTERDWLLEVRCLDEVQRQRITEILDLCDEKGIHYAICYPIKVDLCDSEHRSCGKEVRFVDIPVVYVPSEALHNERRYGDAIHFDIAIDGFEGISVFDMDAPDSIYADYNPKRPWEAAWRYLKWKIPGSKEIGTIEYYIASAIYDKRLLYFRDCFMDWRSPKFCSDLKR